MKIAIISDSHDNLENIHKALDWMNENGIDEIIHCGDVCAPSTLKEIANNFKGKIHLVFGNVDGDYFSMTQIASKDLGNVIIYGQKGELEISDKKIAFVHIPWIAKALAKSGDYDYVFYGHNHKPWEEKNGNCKLLNPGTLAGMFNKATFAVWDVERDNFELKILERM